MTRPSNKNIQDSDSLFNLNSAESPIQHGEPHMDGTRPVWALHTLQFYNTDADDK